MLYKEACLKVTVLKPRKRRRKKKLLPRDTIHLRPSPSPSSSRPRRPCFAAYLSSDGAELLFREDLPQLDGMFVAPVLLGKIRVVHLKQKQAPSCLFGLVGGGGVNISPATGRAFDRWA